MQEEQPVKEQRVAPKKTTSGRGRTSTATTTRTSSSRKTAGRGRRKAAAPKGRASTRRTSPGADVREKLSLAKAALREAKAEFKDMLRKEREAGKAAQNELKQALKREQALIKLIEEKGRVMQTYGDRWAKKQLSAIQAPAKKRRARKRS